MEEKKFEIHKFEPQELDVNKYEIQQFPLIVTDEAKAYVSQNKPHQGSQFTISEIVAKKTGIEDLNEQSFNNLVEEKLALRIEEIKAEVKEAAYKEGHQKGYDQAYEDHRSQIEESLTRFSEINKILEEQRIKIFTENSSELIQLVKLLAEKIVYKSVDEEEETIEKVIFNLLSDMDKGEQISLQLAPADYKFIQKSYEQINKKLEGRKIEFVENENISRGGCVLETEYNSIDATIEERINQVWSVLNQNEIKDKDTLQE